MGDLRELILETAQRVADYRAKLPGADVWPTTSLDELVEGFDRPLSEAGVPAEQVLDELVAAATPGLVASAGPRYFGFVTGGSLDAALCADLMAVGWDQLAYNAVSSPASIAAEVVSGRWLKELLHLPPHASVGFVTGGQAANTVALAAARGEVLQHAGWDDRAGLFGAPPLRVFVGEERHQTIDRALRLLGIGEASIRPLATNGQGALSAIAVRDAFAEPSDAPTIVCTQAGNVATGAFDEIGAICDLAHERGAWVHVDGAFGLWAAASPSTRPLIDGYERADSWATDAHKWLNVPYDSGLTICAHPDAHTRAMRYTAAYLAGSDATATAGADLTPESSRRARGFAVWAAIRSLGRSGPAELVDRCCRLARRFADELGAAEGVEVLNDVVLNQVLVHFGDDDRTDRVVERVQRGGTCWVGPTTWRGRRAMRISVSGWLTTDADVDASVAAMLAAYRSR
ncbi:MAG TPA: pyridoxal-dependent decarboxylase [Acidimicrobiia bacterium]|nr:pyridoxal-dependent decarboxylase [Acidimicrobiia bacterium]